MNQIITNADDYKAFEKIKQKYYVRVFPKEIESGNSIMAYEKVFYRDPSQEEIADVETECLNELKSNLVRYIRSYDSSENVNAFVVNGLTAWLDKATRVGLINSANAAKSEGIEQITLWLGTRSFTVGCDMLIAMLNQLELYAMQCYNKTAEHIASVEAENDVRVLEDYDYTIGYPEKLNFDLQEA